MPTRQGRKGEICKPLKVKERECSQASEGGIGNSKD